MINILIFLCGFIVGFFISSIWENKKAKKIPIDDADWWKNGGEPPEYLR